MADEEYIGFPGVEDVPEDLEPDEVAEFDVKAEKYKKKKKKMELELKELKKKREKKQALKELKKDIRGIKREKYKPVVKAGKRAGKVAKRVGKRTVKEAVKTGKGFIRLGKAYQKSAKKRHGVSGDKSSGDMLGVADGENKWDWNLGKGGVDMGGKKGGGGMFDWTLGSGKKSSQLDMSLPIGGRSRGKPRKKKTKKKSRR